MATGDALSGPGRGEKGTGRCGMDDELARRSQLAQTLGHTAEGEGGPPYNLRCECGQWEGAGFVTQDEAMNAHWAHVQEEARR